MARRLNTEIFELPVGVIDKDGNLHNLCEVSEMIGSDEEAISDKKVASNPANVITTLLQRKIVRIGDIEKITPALVKNMYTADRDMCLMEIRKLSLGDEMGFGTKCPACKEKSEVNINLAKDIDVTYWNKFEDDSIVVAEEVGTVEFELPVGVEDNDGEVHKKGTLKLPTGDIEERLSAMLRQNPSKANTALLSACIKSLGTMKMVDTKVLRDMTRRDREYLTELMRKAKCGPDFVQEVACDFCGNTYNISLELPYFFTVNSGN